LAFKFMFLTHFCFDWRKNVRVNFWVNLVFGQFQYFHFTYERFRGGKFISKISWNRFFETYFLDYIDVGDVWWRRNVMATNLRCWWRFWPFSSPKFSIFYYKLRAPTSKKCHEYRNWFTNTWKLSPTSTCHQHLCRLFPQLSHILWNM